MKSWQIFVFSLIPLALVFAGVIGGSIAGSDRELETFPTPAPRATSDGPAPTPVPGATTLDVVAENLLFDTSTLTAAANQPVQVNFDNRDAGVPHNIAFYTNDRADQEIFVGELTTGPETTTYSFDAPQAGTYFFRCDVHPDTMRGTFTVQ